MEFDVVVMGSGAAGLTAAIRAAKSGLSVAVLEKSNHFGGTTAISGGGIWIPANPQARDNGVDDSIEKAEDYVLRVVGDRANPALIEAYLHNGPEMVKWLDNNTVVTFLLSPPSCDWYPEHAGAAEEGRLLAPTEYDGKQLGADFNRLSRPREEFNAPGGMMIDLFDLPYIERLPAPGALWHMAKIAIRFTIDKLRFGRGSRLTMGTALAARLLKSAVDAGVTLLENTAVESLTIESNRVTGVTASVNGVSQGIVARKGVVLASGGFSANAQMRKTYIPYADQHISILPYENTGDGISAAVEIGAVMGENNHANAVWSVVSKRTREDGYVERYAHLMDMSKPGCIAVNKAGERFANEASVHFVEAMHATGTVPAHIIADEGCVRKYGLGLSLAGGGKIKALVDSGYLIKGATLEELAEKIDVDAAGLKQTVEKVNSYAATGKDLAFGKGDTPIDIEIGDSQHKPNPCLGPVGSGPYYAIEIFPGDGSTTVGVKIDEFCRVTDKDSTPIPGLYAAGLDANSIWQGKSPAHGCAVGPAMVLGYIAGKSVADNPS
jgi:succinate dehydrogenase/fumarate reductase flavoprotein subunit